MSRSWPRGSAVLGAALAILPMVSPTAAAAQGTPAAGPGLAPRLAVDPFWPKPLPNQWLLGQVAGVAVDAQDHVWIVQRPRTLTEDERGAALTPPRSECCVPAPAVLEFDADGSLVQGWGGPGEGYDWPESEHGIFVDLGGAVWVAGNGPRDHQVLKFSRDGRFLLQIGKPGESGGDGDTANLNRPADTRVDEAANELYVADGYGNHRVIVFDATSGAYKRHWGANGLPPGDATVKGFGNPVHCLRIAADDLVYVCDRQNNRIQVFRKDGRFVTEWALAPDTRGNGSAWDLDFSKDPEQAYLYVADGENNHLWILSRPSGAVLSRVGRPGRYAGQFHWVHNMAVDSQGNVYASEVDTGKRVQKFVFQGLAPAGP